MQDAPPRTPPSVEGPDDAVVVEGIRKSFGGAPALDGCTLHVARGSFTSLLGPSGCGKTTLLRIIGGFEHADAGSVRIHGETVDGLPPNKRNVNTVFQSYALFPHQSVFENVAFPLVVARVPKAERAERVREALALVRLEGAEDRAVTKLSGGQSQRVALARAIVGRPEVLLLDEPLAALDLKLRKTMQLELRRIQEQLGTTFIYVTHDQEEALTMSDRIVLMHGGHIVQGGSPEDVYDRPNSVFVSDFVGEVNHVEGRLDPGSGERAVVETAAGRVVVRRPGPEIAAGPVVLSLRPERIALRTAPVESAENGLPGVLERRVFLGNRVRCLVRVAGDTVLTVELDRVAAAAVTEGADVVACFAARDVTVLPGDRPA
ncbi:ABC transporter ATP-binding protein [Patulibacter sp. SYSU D01012]|uniref:ABC transporter ATP-binding protein n=1 Tax=Patulibacter sp. SYSU D01012 TaxID=2817381 RepID=UPI001B310911|nr:ABC transporter ATP-binding protein [Patulibacter sp. SYSU D01012]